MLLCSQKKQNTVKLILSLIIFISGAFVALDWFRFYLYDGKSIPYEYPPIKFGIPLLTFALVWLIGKDGWEKADTFWLKIIFSNIVLAELFFISGFRKIAIALYACCQILLVIRNGRSFLTFFPKVVHKKLLILSGILVLNINFLSSSLIIYPLLKDKFLFALIITYIAIISISLWTAFINFILKLFPYKNGLLTLVGMLCFFICDCTVGLSISLPKSFMWMLANSLTWIFFTPALVLLSLSGYRLNQRQLIQDK